MLNGPNLFYIEPDIATDCPAIKNLEAIRYSPVKTRIDELAHSLSPDLVNYLILEFHMALRYTPHLENLFYSPNLCHTIIFNAPEQITTSDLLKLGHIKGYFFTGDNSKKLCSGICSVLDGNYSLPACITNQLLDYYQSVVLRHTEPHFTNLTKRELEVLQSLKIGMSNDQLADELYVSEHTVKSHLYKIFKKLGVKNRNQAIVWAHKFLP